MECFVCAGGTTDGPLFRVCNCNARIHVDCFKRLVCVPSHRTHCAVCRAKYNITTTSKLQCFVHKLFCVAWSFSCLVTIASLTSFASLFSPHAVPAEERLALRLLYGAISVMSLVLLVTIWISYYRNTGQICCAWYQKVDVPTIVHVAGASARVP